MSESKYRAALEAIRQQAVKTTSEPERLLGKIAQIAGFALEGAPEAGPATGLGPGLLPVQALVPAINLGGLVVGGSWPEGFDVALNGKPLRASRITVELDLGKPPEAEIRFFLGDRDGDAGDPSGTLAAPGDDPGAPGGNA